MKRNTLLIVLLFSLALLSGVCVGLLTATNEEVPPVAVAEEAAQPSPVLRPSPSPEVTLEPQREVSIQEKYMVSMTDSKIFIYKISANGDMQIVEEKPINARALPQSDYESLFQGIIVDTLLDAKEMVEDYIS